MVVERRASPRTSWERININGAGIDCGAAEHYVAVPPDRDPSPVQSFKTFTCDLQRLADGLTACRVSSVAMEATGVYWIPLYEILEGAGDRGVARQCPACQERARPDERRARL